VDTLRALDTRVEGDAIVIAHANVIVFERVMRRRAERVLAPIGIDEFQLPNALADVPRLRTTGAPRDWLRPPLPRPTAPAAVERRVLGLLAERRPVYFVPTLAAKTGAVRAMQKLLAERFRLRRMGAAGPGSFQRVEHRAAQPRR
jgi:hypothetical protein